MRARAAGRRVMAAGGRATDRFRGRGWTRSPKTPRKSRRRYLKIGKSEDSGGK